MRKPKLREVQQPTQIPHLRSPGAWTWTQVCLPVLLVISVLPIYPEIVLCLTMNTFSLLYLPNLDDFVKKKMTSQLKNENKQTKITKNKTTASLSQAAEVNDTASGK